jgi:hypothetical protein
MFNIGNATSFRKTIAGLSLIVAPLTGLIGVSLLPAFTNGMEGELAFIAGNTDRWLLGLYLDLLTWLLLIPAVIGLMHLLRRRAVILGHIGGSLMLVGLFFHAAVLGFQFVEAPLVVSKLDHAQMVALTEQIYEHKAFVMLLMPFLGFYAGLILLAVALWWARVAPSWVAFTIIAAIAGEFFGPPQVHTHLMLGLLLVAFGWIGLKVLRMPEARWEQGDMQPSTAATLASKSASAS